MSGGRREEMVPHQRFTLPSLLSLDWAVRTEVSSLEACTASHRRRDCPKTRLSQKSPPPPPPRDQRPPPLPALQRSTRAARAVRRNGRVMAEMESNRSSRTSSNTLPPSSPTTSDASTWLRRRSCCGNLCYRSESSSISSVSTWLVEFAYRKVQLLTKPYLRARPCRYRDRLQHVHATGAGVP